MLAKARSAMIRLRSMFVMSSDELMVWSMVLRTWRIFSNMLAAAFVGTSSSRKLASTPEVRAMPASSWPCSCFKRARSALTIVLTSSLGLTTVPSGDEKLVLMPPRNWSIFLLKMLSSGLFVTLPSTSTLKSEV